MEKKPKALNIGQEIASDPSMNSHHELRSRMSWFRTAEVAFLILAIVAVVSAVLNVVMKHI